MLRLARRRGGSGAWAASQSQSRAAASRVTSRVPGSRRVVRRRRSCQKPPLPSPAGSALASQTMVSAPCSGVRSSGRNSQSNRGSAAAIPGVATQPGCRAWNATSAAATRRAHSALSATWARLACA